MSAANSNSTMTMKLQHTQGLLSSTVLTQKQGIVTILGCHRDSTNTASSAAASSLRRTLSADMSSKKWLPLPQNGSSEQLFHHPKTIADSSSSSEGEDDDYEETKEMDAESEAERERLEIWASIQRNKKEEQEKAGSFDTWSSLIALKTKDEISKSLPSTPYIHPLVKSKSSLSGKSLEICTESLGSETGSDGLVSSYPPSETGGDAEEEEEEEQHEEEEEEKVKESEEVLRYNYGTAATTKKSPPRSFPPPLPSLSRQTGPSLHMRPHRDNGRLVLEAVSLPSQNNFCVQRQDGRLVLTFADQEDAEKEEKENDGVEELEEEFGAFEEEKEDEDEDEDEDEYEDEDGESECESDVRDVECVIEKAPLLSSGITASVNGLASKVNKPIGLVNRNPKWSEKFNEVVNFEDVDVVEATQMVQSLPPRPRVARLIPSAAPAAAAASFNLNAYEHYWRTKPTAKDAVAKPLARYQENYNDSTLKMKNNSSKIIFSNEKQQVLVLRGKNGDYLVHNLKSCKDSRRSFLFWEPYCIATS